MVSNEKKGAKRRGFTFEDVSIVPAYSTILPGDIDVSTFLTRSIKLNIPIVSAAMDSVTESGMAIRMAQNGGIGIIHHYLSTERQIEEIKKVKRYESWIIDHPFTISPDESLGAVRELMSEHNISGIPVIDKEKLISEAARIVRPDGVIAFTDWIEGKAGLTEAEAERFLTFMKFPNVHDLEGYSDLLAANGCEAIAAEDTGRFGPYVDLYLNMLDMQLTYDALKIVGFDNELMKSMAAEMTFMQQLAHAGKIAQGLFVARKKK